MNRASSRTSACGAMAVVLTAMLAAAECRAEPLSGSWKAQNAGSEGLRLDGLFGKSAPVGFSFTDVNFTANADGTAALTGQVSVAYNGGDPAGNGVWQLDVHFYFIEEVGGFHYYEIDSTSKLTRADGVVDLRGSQLPETPPFRIGIGAVEGSSAFGGYGLVDGRRNGTLFDEMDPPDGQFFNPSDGPPWFHNGPSALQFELSNDDVQPVPAPPALALGLIGAGGLAVFRRWRRAAV